MGDLGCTGWGSEKGAIGGESMERKWNSSEDFILLNGVLDSLCCRYHVKQVVIYDNLVCIGRRGKRVKKEIAPSDPSLSWLSISWALLVFHHVPRPSMMLFSNKNNKTQLVQAQTFFCRKIFPISEKAAS